MTHLQVLFGLIIGLLLFLGVQIYVIIRAVLELDEQIKETKRKLDNAEALAFRHHNRIEQVEIRVLRVQDLLEKTSTLLEESEKQDARMQALAERMMKAGV